MDDAGSDHLYSRYCSYTQQLNQAVRLQAAGYPPVRPMSPAQFRTIWNSLSVSRREFWRLRFEVGFDETVQTESRKLGAAVSSGDISPPVVRLGRAA